MYRSGDCLDSAPSPVALTGWMESLAAQDGTPALSDVSADRIDGEHRPRLLRTTLGGRDISRTNEYKADLP